MPLLDAHGRFVPDAFSRLPARALASASHVLVPLADLPDASLPERLVTAPPKQEIGIEIANTTPIETLLPHLGALALIAIAFPAYSDGRGFTLAKRLRRAGFSRALRAVGPLIADQFAYALACGFDELELPEESASRQPADHWIKAAAAFSATYQRGYARGENILDQRRAARKEASNG